MDDRASQPPGSDIAAVLSTLEAQLVELDQMGASIAAAHLDAAIHALRLHQALESHSEVDN